MWIGTGSSRTARLSAAFTSLALVAVLVTGCGDDKGSDSGAKQGRLSVKATASSYAGPAPLEVEFSAQVNRSNGPVTYLWDFGDGTTSTERSPKHQFKKPDFYAMTLRSKDKSGATDLTNLILRAFDPQKWDKLHDKSKPVTRASAAATVKDSLVSYYSKYPQALPYDPSSSFYDQYPYARAILRKYERENPAVARKHRKQILESRRAQAEAGQPDPK